MATQWCCKLEDREVGPMTFQELVDLVREGKVNEGVLVSRAGTLRWEPAWKVVGLFRAAGIVAPGDSPPPADPEVKSAEAIVASAASGAPAQPENPLLTISNAVRSSVAAAVGMVAIAFFYRWGHQTMMTFPMRPQVVDGELIDSYFPVIGRCTRVECFLLYLDVFAVAAVATWHATSGWMEDARAYAKSGLTGD